MAHQSRDFVDYLISLTPIFIAAFVAFIAYQQSKVGRDKLRLDLYNKRFNVYERTLLFYQSIAVYDGSKNADFYSKLHAFNSAMKESQFLFSASSRIFNLLSDIHLNAYKIIGFKENGKEVFKSGDHITVSRLHNEMQDTLTQMAFQIDAIEKAMKPYLNFHKMVS